MRDNIGGSLQQLLEMLGIELNFYRNLLIDGGKMSVLLQWVVSSKPFIEPTRIKYPLTEADDHDAFHKIRVFRSIIRKAPTCANTIILFRVIPNKQFLPYAHGFIGKSVYETPEGLNLLKKLCSYEENCYVNDDLKCICNNKERRWPNSINSPYKRKNTNARLLHPHTPNGGIVVNEFIATTVGNPVNWFMKWKESSWHAKEDRYTPCCLLELYVKPGTPLIFIPISNGQNEVVLDMGLTFTFLGMQDELFFQELDDADNVVASFREKKMYVGSAWDSGLSKRNLTHDQLSMVWKEGASKCYYINELMEATKEEFVIALDSNDFSKINLLREEVIETPNGVSEDLTVDMDQKTITESTTFSGFNKSTVIKVIKRRGDNIMTKLFVNRRRRVRPYICLKSIKTGSEKIVWCRSATVTKYTVHAPVEKN